MSGSAELRRGRLVVLEGIDGCGKSTQAKLLSTAVGAVLTAEPGATALGAELRSLLLDPAKGTSSLRAEALLMAADRAEHVKQVVLPALDAGTCVVSDRFTASTLAYQGYGRLLDLGELAQITAFATGGLEPDLQILLDLPVDSARSRMRPASYDRLEHLGDDFFERVRQGYLDLAAGDPNRWAVLDATADVDVIAARILDVVTTRLDIPNVADG
jgi:dTMP kinase